MLIPSLCLLCGHPSGWLICPAHDRAAYYVFTVGLVSLPFRGFGPRRLWAVLVAQRTSIIPHAFSRSPSGGIDSGRPPYRYDLPTVASLWPAYRHGYAHPRATHKTGIGTIPILCPQNSVGIRPQNGLLASERAVRTTANPSPEGIPLFLPRGLTNCNQLQAFLLKLVQPIPCVSKFLLRVLQGLSNRVFPGFCCLEPGPQIPDLIQHGLELTKRWTASVIVVMMRLLRASGRTITTMRTSTSPLRGLQPVQFLIRERVHGSLRIFSKASM